MRAAWYESRGSASEALVVGEMPDPEPDEGEVRIKVEVSGLSPGDVKKRAGWQGSPMPFPRVIPHSDGAGTIDAVGEGIDVDRVGERVWCYGAQSYRPFGTAAEYVVVPDALAIALPVTTEASDRDLGEQAACLGIAGITGYRAVFADGSVKGLTVLVHGAVGGVGSIATQMAVRGEATVIAGVRDGQQDRARRLGAHHVVVTDDPGAADAIRRIAPDGVARIAEVDLAAHIDLDADVIATGGTICSYFSSEDRPEIPTGSSDSRTPPCACWVQTTFPRRSRRMRPPSSQRRSPSHGCDRPSPPGSPWRRSPTLTSSSSAAQAAG